MNLDLLIKLVKLANNNPSEHEANSAARRACKLIAEGDYKFTAEPPKNPRVEVRPQGPFQGASNPSGSAYDWFSEFFKNQANRPYEERKRSYYGGFDWGKEADEEDARRRRHAQQNVYEPSQAQQDFYNQRNQWNPEAKKPKIRRVCTTCGVDVETSNMKDPFICGMCQWQKWREEHQYDK